MHNKHAMLADISAVYGNKVSQLYGTGTAKKRLFLTHGMPTWTILFCAWMHGDVFSSAAPRHDVGVSSPKATVSCWLEAYGLYWAIRLQSVLWVLCVSAVCCSPLSLSCFLVAISATPTPLTSSISTRFSTTPGLTTFVSDERVLICCGTLLYFLLRRSCASVLD